MERDNRIELSPPPWQGGVLPLYESRIRSDFAVRSFIARTSAPSKAAHNVQAMISEVTDFTRSVDFHYACALDDGRFFLPFGEILGALTVDINASELLSVMVVNSHLPMAVLSPAVLVELGRTPCLLLRHDCIAPIGNAGQYCKFQPRAQVATLRLTPPIFIDQCPWTARL
jgi:hypothetical protein